jgi:hypothetical protein
LWRIQHEKTAGIRYTYMKTPTETKDRAHQLDETQLLVTSKKLWQCAQQYSSAASTIGKDCHLSTQHIASSWGYRRRNYKLSGNCNTGCQRLNSEAFTRDYIHLSKVFSFSRLETSTDFIPESQTRLV